MPANPIFGGGWADYLRNRRVPRTPTSPTSPSGLNSNPNLSSGEYAARLSSMGSPTNAQSYADYMASDDYASGWRPGGTTTPTTGQRPPLGGLLGSLFGGMGGWPQQPAPTPTPTPAPTPTPTGNYAVPIQYNGIPNIIPVGASITDGTTTTPWNTGGGPVTPPVGGGGGGGYPWTPPTGGTTNPNNMSYPPNYPGVPTGGYYGNPNNMSYAGANSPQPAPAPVVQQWNNNGNGNGNGNRNGNGNGNGNGGGGDRNRALTQEYVNRRTGR